MWMWRRFIKESILASFLQIKTKHTSLKSNKVTDSAAYLMAGTVIGIKQAAGSARRFLSLSSSRSSFSSEPLNISAFSRLPPTSAAFSHKLAL